MTYKPHPLAPRKPQWKLPTIKGAMADNLKNPVVGVTQGGSSRKNSGSRVAAVDYVMPKPKGK